MMLRQRATHLQRTVDQVSVARELQQVSLRHLARRPAIAAALPQLQPAPHAQLWLRDRAALEELPEPRADLTIQPICRLMIASANKRAQAIGKCQPLTGGKIEERAIGIKQDQIKAPVHP